ncbi:hypothetical protein AOLI_G00127810 [Acnodon oligacanthus]
MAMKENCVPSTFLRFIMLSICSSCLYKSLPFVGGDVSVAFGGENVNNIINMETAKLKVEFKAKYNIRKMTEMSNWRKHMSVEELKRNIQEDLTLWLKMSIGQAEI